MTTKAANQRGAILVVALVLLVLLGLMGTTSLRSVIFQEKVVAQMHDHAVAFEAAEAGLAWCEMFFGALQFAYTTGDETVNDMRIGDEIADSNDPASALVVAREQGGAWFLDEALWAATSARQADIELSGDDGIASVAQHPRCLRERVLDADTSAGPKYFYETFSNKDDVMADKMGGSASRSGGIYHFRAIAQGYGRGSSEQGRAVSSMVLQSDYFKRLE
jgi:Tfp pilus assembly protein PilX